MRKLMGLALLIPTLGVAQVPDRLGYQGRLLQSDGTPVGGTVSITFSLYNTATPPAGTQPLWTETQNVALQNGFYSGYLGDVPTSSPLSNVLTGNEVYLQVSVGGTALTPLQRVDSVPYAIMAQNVSGGTVSATTVNVTGGISVNGTTVINASGSLVGPAVPQAGDGIAISGNTISVNSAGCSAGEVLEWSGTAWVCGVGPSGVVTLNLQANALASCSAILAAGGNPPDGLYWINPGGGPTSNAFVAYCDMTTQGGGWTLVMNVEPADGSVVSFTNTTFWVTAAEYGQIGNHFTHDYKGPAAWLLAGTNIMVQVANPGPHGNIIGWKAWSMTAQSFGVFFNSAPNTVQTTSVIGSNVANVYTYEPLIKNGTQLRSNLSINANADRVRLGVDTYPVQGDDNSPGLGTQMNEAICGVGVNCYRYRDVELWVNSASNLWCTPSTPGTYGWIGTDGSCGSSCNNSCGTGCNCDVVKGQGYSPYWTYRIYVR